MNLSIYSNTVHADIKYVCRYCKILYIIDAAFISNCILTDEEPLTAVGSTLVWAGVKVDVWSITIWYILNMYIIYVLLYSLM